MFDLVIKSGKVIDPSQNIHEKMDIGITEGKIASLRENIPAEEAREVREVAGKIVVPGLVDLHTHVYWGGTSLGVAAEELGRRSGVTTFIDAGSSGAGNFSGFQKHIIKPSSVQILAFLNISYPGIFCLSENLKFGELVNLELASVEEAVKTGQAYPQSIVGIKVRASMPTSGTHGMTSIHLARQAAKELGKPIMVHIGVPPPTVEEVLPLLREGDILTHSFRGIPNQVLQSNGEIIPELREARQRGVVIDIGHGIGSFSFKVARSLLEQGFSPDTVSSDIHILGLQGPTYDLPTTMSKFLNLGMDIEEIIRATTWTPAQVIGREKEMGNLKQGRRADIAILEIREGKFKFYDCLGEEMIGEKRISCVLAIKDGRIL